VTNLLSAVRSLKINAIYFQQRDINDLRSKFSPPPRGPRTFSFEHSANRLCFILLSFQFHVDNSTWNWHLLVKRKVSNNRPTIHRPNHVVSAETVNTFKNRLDKFWLVQEVLYDYNRSPWHREPQYSLAVIIRIDNVIYWSMSRIQRPLRPASVLLMMMMMMVMIRERQYEMLF